MKTKLLVLFIFLVGSANASIINFQDTSITRTWGAVDSTDGLFRLSANSGGVAFIYDISGGNALQFNGSFTLVKIDGGSFTLNSLDFASKSNNSTGVSLTITGTFADTGPNPVVLTPTNSSFSNEGLNWHNLTSVTFLGVKGGTVNPAFTDISLTAGVTEIDFDLTVVNGTGDESYAQDADVAISAVAPSDAYVFTHWTSDNGGTFADATSADTTFTMPAVAATVTAHYNKAKNDFDGDGMTDLL